MAWYERRPISKSAEEIGYITKLPGIDVMAIHAYTKILRAAVMGCRERARAVLSFSTDHTNKTNVTLTQTTSGIFIDSVFGEFKSILPYDLNRNTSENVPSSIWTGTEKANIGFGRTIATPSLSEGSKLIIDTLSTPDAHYMELEEWRDAVMSEPSVLESGISVKGLIPVLAIEAKHTSR